MTLRTIIIAILCLGMADNVYSQQDPLYSQYMFNMVGINPAYAGSREILSITGMIRSQWTGVDGAPVSKVIIGDYSSKSRKIGLAMQVFNDQIGIMKTTGVNVSYAYRLHLSKGVLSMGLQGGVTQFKADYSAVQLSGNQTDPAFSSNVNEFEPSLGAGVFYSTEKFYAGFSSPHMLHYNTVIGQNISSKNLYERNHWFLTTGYVFELSPSIDLKPSILARMVNGAPITVDINAQVWLRDLISVGLSVRTSKMFVGMLEIQATRQFRVGYAYDYTAAMSRNFDSHEIMLRYEFGYEKKNMVSPRHF